MLPLIVWDSTLSVGIEEIDEQHKILISLLNEINEAVQQRRSNVAAKEIINKLIKYTRIHFAVEESIMRILNYPEYDSHKEQHKSLMQGVVNLADKIESGKITVGFELQNFLKHWLTKHIFNTDKQYTEHFLKSGVQAKLQNSNWWDIQVWDNLIK